MAANLKGRDFVSLAAYSKEDLETILNLALDLKRKQLIGERHRLLEGKELGMLFFHPSTRTRISFETAMSQLGGHAQFYGPEHLHVFLRESLADTGNVMSRFLDGIMVRIYHAPGQEPKYGSARSILNEIAANASIPVINALDDQEHPCQVMGDILTMIEKFGPDYKRKKVAVVWCASPTVISPGVSHSLALAGGKLGMNLIYAYPEGFDLDAQYIREGSRLVSQSGGKLVITHSINEAVENADVIYAKGWGLMNKTESEYLEVRKSLVDWRIMKEHFDIANPGAIFMHPMPIAREIDATNEVADGPMSVIYDQAENRLHAEKAILSLIM